MAGRTKRVALRGSERTPPAGALVSGKVDPSETARVTVILRPHPPSFESRAVLVDRISGPVPRDRDYPTREQFEAEYGATREEIARLEKEIATLRSTERFTAPCVFCGKPMNFSSNKKNWTMKVQPTLHRAFEKWFHIECKPK